MSMTRLRTMSAIASAVAAMTAAVTLLPAHAAELRSAANPLPPTVPSCFEETGVCLGLSDNAPTSVTEEDNQSGKFTLTAPGSATSLDLIHPASCGDLGCLYHHYNWLLPPYQAKTVKGCGPNEPTCTLQLLKQEKDNWFPVEVQADSYTAASWVLWRHAEKDATIKGEVKDSDGEGIPGVAISAAGKRYYSTITDDDGSYEIVGRPGKYKVEPTHGSKLFKPTDVKVHPSAGGSAHADFKQIGCKTGSSSRALPAFDTPPGAYHDDKITDATQNFSLTYNAATGAVTVRWDARLHHCEDPHYESATYNVSGKVFRGGAQAELKDTDLGYAQVDVSVPKDDPLRVVITRAFANRTNAGKSYEVTVAKSIRPAGIVFNVGGGTPAPAPTP
jgi:hypothetical protein